MPLSLNGVESEPLDSFMEYTIFFEMKMASGARKHGLGRRRIEQALAGHAVAEPSSVDRPIRRSAMSGWMRGEWRSKWLASSFPGFCSSFRERP